MIGPSCGCTIPACARPERCRGLCSRHYYQARRAGTLDAQPQQRHRGPQPVCRVSRCGQAVHARAYCSRHYQGRRSFARLLAQREAA